VGCGWCGVLKYTTLHYTTPREREGIEGMGSACSTDNDRVEDWCSVSEPMLASLRTGDLIYYTFKTKASGLCECMCVCMCEYACVCVCVSMRVCVCV
jgi:hypothetical protein